MSELAIGIDLGTYNSCAAYALSENQVQMIRSAYGPTLQGIVFPSFLRFDAQGNVVAYGEEARQQMALAPEQVIWGAKRLIGRPFNQVGQELWRFAYPIRAGANGGVGIPVGPERFTPAQVATLLLKWIKQNAEAYNPFITGAVSKAVVTHPAYFDALQTEQTKAAALDSGFAEVELIPEPVAAALAYGVRLDPSQPQFIMAIDWGAGTLDIAMMALRQGQGSKPVLGDVIPARGDVALGGMDMDDLLLARAIEMHRLEHLQPLLVRKAPSGPWMAEAMQAPSEDWADFYRLRTCIERAKIALSVQPAAMEDTIIHGQPLRLKLARTKKDKSDRDAAWVILEETLQPALQKFKAHIEFALQQSGLKADHFQHVVLIGGPMYMPCVRQMVRQVFSANKAVQQELQTIEARGFPVNPMESVARGAALYACRAGPALGARRIARDYGVLLGAQGQIVVHDGAGLPCNEPFPGELSHPGRPGDAVSIGLFVCEKSPETGPEGRYKRLGEYEYTAYFDNGVSHFQPWLRIDPSGIVSLVVKDLHSGSSMTLENLSALDGLPIPKPMGFDFREDRALPPDQPGQSVSASVDGKNVELLRRKALGALPFARSMREHPRVKSDPRLRAALEERIAALDESLRGLPASGSADQRVFQQAANRLMELRAFLDTNQLLTREGRILLSQ